MYFIKVANIIINIIIIVIILKMWNIKMEHLDNQNSLSSPPSKFDILNNKIEKIAKDLNNKDKNLEKKIAENTTYINKIKQEERELRRQQAEMKKHY